MILIVLLCIILGLISIISPRSSWYLQYGWRYKDAEPSDFALIMERVGGVALIIVAIIIMFTGG